jgi:phosphatidylinositol-3-phosphatase
VRNLLFTIVVVVIASAMLGQVPTPSHVFIVVEENKNYSRVIGNSSMPYLNSLASQYGLAQQYYADTHPSIGNYFMMTTGQILTNDDSKTPSNFPVSEDNIVRHLLTAGKTWKSYAEDLPSVGYTGGNSGNYLVRHNPFAYFTDVQYSSSQKMNLVPFNPQFATDVANNTLPDYSFIVPNKCNDAHDCSLATADNWLRANIVPLISSKTFQQDGVLIILFDEAGNDSTHGGGRVAWIVVSPKAKPGYKSTKFYQHESTLRTTMKALGMNPDLGAASTASGMGEFFHR